MPQCWSYGLGDAQIFSARAYGRLVERCMHEAWPAQLVAAALGLTVLMMLVLLRRRPIFGARALAIVAALGCAGVAAWWLPHCYAELHWIADAMAVGFALQAGLLAAAASWPGALRRAASPVAHACATALFTFALVVLPWLSAPAGSSAWRIEVIGLMPAPCIAASLAVVPLSAPRWRLLLLPLPLAGTVLEAVTLASIGLVQWMLLPLQAIVLAAMLLALRAVAQAPSR
jgi:hypothetical protein